MRPKQQRKPRHDDLFRARLDQIINMKHALVVLADKIDWVWLDDKLAGFFADEGRPAEPVRFMIGMFLLKHAYTLSDEDVWERWVHNPYFQHFTGEEFFQHELPHERSGMAGHDPDCRAARSDGDTMHAGALGGRADHRQRPENAVGTMVERMSRYVILAQVENRTSAIVRQGFTRQMKDVPPLLRKSITYDRGSEMARHKLLEAALDPTVYFADPYAPWQRGTNENTNGLEHRTFNRRHIPLL